MQFIKPNVLHCPGHAVGEDHGFTDKLGLGLLERAQDIGRADLGGWHGHGQSRQRCGLICLKGGQVVTAARQTREILAVHEILSVA